LRCGASARDNAPGLVPGQVRRGRKQAGTLPGWREGRGVDWCGADARRAWEPFGGPGHPPAARLDAFPLLFAVGTPDEVAAVARELRAAGDAFRYRFYGATDVAATLDFLEGKMSEADLLRRPASTAGVRGRWHHLVGWQRLGAGDREGARAAFRQAFEAFPLGSMVWGIDRAIFIRMQNPDWSRALPKR
jgi:hypothetical protein